MDSMLSAFRAGLRILIISDTCTSGTFSKGSNSRNDILTSADRGEYTKFRFLPMTVAGRVYRKNMKFYDDIVRKSNETREISASVISIRACNENQFASEGPYNGIFTSTVISTWNNGSFKGDYKLFHKRILKRMPDDQNPVYSLRGTRDTKFESQKPFTI
jgi:hypothetical protein